MIPPFDASGNLPPGRHKSAWPEFRERFGVNAHRRRLLAGLYRALKALQAAGCERVFIDGSFVTQKESPADYDGCWDMAKIRVKELDRVFLQFGERRAAQKAKYLGEFLPANLMASSRDTFLEFFQRDRNGRRKGIVVLNLRRLE